MKWNVVFAIGLYFTGVVCAEINNLGTYQYFPTRFSSQVSDVKERDHWFEEKCKKIGHHGTDEELVAAKLETQNCIVTLVNLTELQAEVHETALLGGNVGKVFSKFCRKFPALKNCITSFIATIEPCLNEEETEAVNFVQDVINSILDYICFNDGINILYFIMEGGPECVYSKQEAMKKCLNTLITKYLPGEETFSSDHSAAHAEGKDCRNVKILQTCIVTALHKCPQPTTASIFKNMLELVVMKLSCSNPEQASYVSKVLALPSKLYI